MYADAVLCCVLLLGGTVAQVIAGKDGSERPVCFMGSCKAKGSLMKARSGWPLEFREGNMHWARRRSYAGLLSRNVMMESKDARGWRVLCIDGGGTRGIVPLTVLMSLQARTEKEPWELFDLIVGTSTGGILAVLLGLLKVPLEDCVRIYEDLGETIFEPGLFNKVKGMAVHGARYSAKDFEAHVKKILDDITGNADIKLADLGQEDGGRPYVALVANRDGFDTAYCFTNFKSDDDGNTLTNGVRAWEAIRATSAAPTFFEPARIQVPYVGNVTFYDGGIKHNNPIDVARTLLTRPPFKGMDPFLFVSLGTGMNLFTLGDVSNLKQTAITIAHAATNCETAHTRAWRQLSDLSIPYLRFNPEDGIGDLPMDSTKYVERLRQATQNYLTKEHVIKNRELLVAICNAQGAREAYNMYKRLQIRERQNIGPEGAFHSIFVPLHMQDGSKELEKVRQVTLEALDKPTGAVFLEDLVERRVCGSGLSFIFGDAGSGKTTLFLHLALELAARGGEVPLLIQLRKFTEPIKDFLERFVRKWGMSPTLLLLDGLDEISDRTKLLLQLESLSVKRVIITSRPQELVAALDGLHKIVITSVLRLYPMDRVSVDSLVEGRLKLSWEKGWAFKDWEGVRLRDLIEMVQGVISDAKIDSPLLVWFLLLIAEGEENIDMGKYARDEAALFDKVIDRLLYRGVARMSGESDRERDIKEIPILKEVSAVMAYIVHNAAKDMMGREETWECLDGICGNTDDGYKWRERRVGGRDVLAEITAKYLDGLLSYNGKSGTVVFLHMTIQEYLAAWFLTREKGVIVSLRDKIVQGVDMDDTGRLPPFSWARTVGCNSWNGVHRFALAIKGPKWLADQPGLKEALYSLSFFYTAEEYMERLMLATESEIGHVDRLVELCQEKQWYLRAFAAWSVGKRESVGRYGVEEGFVGWLTDEHAVVRKPAAKAVEAMGPAMADKEEVVEALLGMSTDEVGAVRGNAVWALGMMGPAVAVEEEVVEALLGRLTDEYAVVRRAAVRALGKIGPALTEMYRSVEVLLRRLIDEYAIVRRAAVRALGKMGPAVADKDEVVEALLKMLTDEVGNVRTAATWALGKMGPALADKKKEEVGEALLRRLEDEDWEVRSAAAKALGQMGPVLTDNHRKEDVVEALLGRLTDKDEVVSVNADWALCVMGYAARHTEKLVEHLGNQFVTSTDKNVHYSTALSLITMGSAAANIEGVVECVLERLTCDDVYQRYDTAADLGRMGPILAEKESLVLGLVERLVDTDRYVRRWSAWALGRAGPVLAGKDEVVKGLRDRLMDDDAKVREAARKALEEMFQAL